jgi:hypothetical protein
LKVKGKGWAIGCWSDVGPDFDDIGLFDNHNANINSGTLAWRRLYHRHHTGRNTFFRSSQKFLMTSFKTPFVVHILEWSTCRIRYSQFMNSMNMILCENQLANSGQMHLAALSTLQTACHCKTGQESGRTVSSHGGNLVLGFISESPQISTMTIGKNKWILLCFSNTFRKENPRENGGSFEITDYQEELRTLRQVPCIRPYVSNVRNLVSSLVWTSVKRFSSDYDSPYFHFLSGLSSWSAFWHFHAESR